MIKEAEREIELLLGEDPRVKLLRTVPGFGPILSALAALEIDRIEQFISPSKLASYTGLVPSTYAPGGKIVHGKLIAMSNKMAEMGFGGSGLGFNPYLCLLPSLLRELQAP